MTANEVAVYLKLPEKAVQKLAAKGCLPVVDIGGEYRFKKSVLDRWLTDQAKLPGTGDLALAASTDKSEVGSIIDFMSENSISTRLTAAARDGVLRELVGLVPISAAPMQQALFEALKAREDLCSTATGEGVAIPHARNAMVGLVNDPIIAFGRHPKGIDFGAFDGKPTHLFFLLVSPNVRFHLQLLARLSRLLNQKAVRDTLRKVDKSADVLRVLRAAETP
jgi:excisionase family DNA binding protein